MTAKSSALEEEGTIEIQVHALPVSFWSVVSWVSENPVFNNANVYSIWTSFYNPLHKNLKTKFLLQMYLEKQLLRLSWFPTMFHMNWLRVFQYERVKNSIKYFKRFPITLGGKNSVKQVPINWEMVGWIPCCGLLLCSCYKNNDLNVPLTKWDIRDMLLWAFKMKPSFREICTRWHHFCRRQKYVCIHVFICSCW